MRLGVEQPGDLDRRLGVVDRDPVGERPGPHHPAAGRPSHLAQRRGEAVEPRARMLAVEPAVDPTDQAALAVGERVPGEPDVVPRAAPVGVEMGGHPRDGRGEGADDLRRRAAVVGLDEVDLVRQLGPVVAPPQAGRLAADHAAGGRRVRAVAALDEGAQEDRPLRVLVGHAVEERGEVDGGERPGELAAHAVRRHPARGRGGAAVVGAQPSGIPRVVAVEPPDRRAGEGAGRDLVVERVGDAQRAAGEPPHVARDRPRELGEEGGPERPGAHRPRVAEGGRRDFGGVGGVEMEGALARGVVVVEAEPPALEPGEGAPRVVAHPAADAVALAEAPAGVAGADRPAVTPGHVQPGVPACLPGGGGGRNRAEFRGLPQVGEVAGVGRIGAGGGRRRGRSVRGEQGEAQAGGRAQRAGHMPARCLRDVCRLFSGTYWVGVAAVAVLV